MAISQFFVEFIFYSFLGWIWESIYCSAKEKKWADRGFLFGPICPIYGSCVVAASAAFSSISFLSSPDFPIWGIFVVSYLASAVAEFGTSWVLEKRFHARWWDYSKMPLNIQGRICVPVSIGFGLAGVAIVKYLIPFVNGMHAAINPLVYEVFALIFAILFGADFALTEASLSALLTEVEKMHEEFNIRAQENYEKLASTKQLVVSYAEKLTLNQKRMLFRIRRFMPGKVRKHGKNLMNIVHITDALKDKIRELKG